MISVVSFPAPRRSSAPNGGRVGWCTVPKTTQTLVVTRIVRRRRNVKTIFTRLSESGSSTWCYDLYVCTRNQYWFVVKWIAQEKIAKR